MTTPRPVTSGFAAILIGVAAVSASCSSSTASRSTAPRSPVTTPHNASAAPSTSIAPPGPSSQTTAECRTGNLAVLIGRATGAAGSLVATFHVRNSSTSTCTLTGYFGLELVDAAGHQVGQNPTRQGSLASTPPQSGPILLRPGDRAGFSFEWGDHPIHGQPCPAASQVTLTAPDQFDHTLVPARTADGATIAPCGSGFIQIGPVTPD